jgi:hypothetical protein
MPAHGASRTSETDEKGKTETSGDRNVKHVIRDERQRRLGKESHCGQNPDKTSCSCAQPGQCLPQLLWKGGERERLNERIERFLDRPDAPALYADWKAAAERREIRCFLREARIETTDLRPRSVARLRDAELLRRSDRAGRLPALAGSVLSARAAAWLIRKGVNAQMVETRRRGVCLVTDCGAILTWRSCLDFLAGPPAICSTENLAALLEYRADRDIGRTHALLSSFCHWLGGLE